MLSVGIVKNDFHDHHSGSWSNEWLKICVQKGIRHELVDWRQIGAFRKLCKHDVILWHYNHNSRDEMEFAPGILGALKDAGCVVFPDHKDSRHFDDKMIQSYLLEAHELPTPINYMMHSLDAVEDWIDSVGEFPVVAKLKAGSGASNVKLIKDSEQLKRYARRMFGRGFSSKPSTLFKIKSNASSSRSFHDVISRLKRAPEFFFTRKQAAALEREKGYVYLQQFIDGVDYDLKVVVIGDQLSFIGRAVRKGDFRASGGGDLFYNRDLMSSDLIKTAFSAAIALESDCVGFDMIIDPRNNQPLILEVSYGFSHTALVEAGGHYDRSGVWHDIPLNAPEAILMRMLNRAKTDS